MRLSTFITVACIAAAAAHANEHPAKLVGRWRSENMPVGYWVTDRYANGRLAKKEYVGDYSDEPAEITVTWGRWRLRGKAYSEFFESATTHEHIAASGGRCRFSASHHSVFSTSAEMDMTHTKIALRIPDLFSRFTSRRLKNIVGGSSSILSSPLVLPFPHG